MSIDEMVTYLWDHNHDDEITEAIIAKLRAGQAMRNSASFTGINDGVKRYRATEPVDKSRGFSAAIRAWDAI